MMFPEHTAKHARCLVHMQQAIRLRRPKIDARCRGFQSAHHKKNEHNCSSTAARVTGTIPRGGQGIAVGKYAEICRVFTAEEIFQYGSLIGDLNPIHLEGHGTDRAGYDTNHAANIDPKLMRIRSEDGRPEAVVHGMLVGSLFSSIFGTLIPGSVYRSQRLEFRQPVFANDPIVARVEVADVRNMKGRGLLVTCETTIASADENLAKYVEGEAKVWLPGI